MLPTRFVLALILAIGVCFPVMAQVKIGVTLSTSGPAASLGIPERNAISLAPKEIGGEPIKYIILNDSSDPTAGRHNVERFVKSNNVDLIIGSSTSPISLALIDVASRAKTPMISLGAARAIVYPMDNDRRWVFKTPYNDRVTAAATVNHMKANGVESVATLAFNQAYGENWIRGFEPLAEDVGIEVVAKEWYSPTDTSVTAQALKIMSKRPDAVLIVASGTPGALPQATLVQRGYNGKIYQTTGVVNNEFIRVGGESVDGVLIAAPPLVVADELPNSSPVKDIALDFSRKYEAEFGKGSINSFAGYAWDAILIAQVALEKVLATGLEPGTTAFRAALRDAIEGSDGVATTAGLVTMSPKDHNGYDADAPVMITIKNGEFTLAE